MADHLPATNNPVRFGVFELNPCTGELRKHGVRIKLQDQPFAVLLVLLEKPGQLITREELQQRLWPADTFVEFDKGIYNAMKRLRETLGDEAETPRYIETIPKRGYRFLAEVHKIGTTAGSVFPIEQPSPKIVPTSTHLGQPAIPRESATEYRQAKREWIPVTSVLFVLLCWLGIWWYTRSRSEAATRAMEVVPLVGLDGAQSRPAFSPDGNQIVFALHNEKSPGIYSTLVSGGKPLRLTNGPRDGFPRWCPDGQHIAFARLSEDRVAIYALPALGGVERKLYEGFASLFSHAFDCSPDGRVLAISQVDPDKTHARIALLSVANSEIRPLTAPSELDLDSEPAFSPDGSAIAFVRSNVGGMVSELYVVPVIGGEAKRVTFDRRTIAGSLAWSPDGKEILFSSTRSGSPSLWRVSASGAGTPQPIAGGSMNAYDPTLSRKGNQLAYQQVLFQSGIWRLDLTGKRPRPGTPVFVIGAKGWNFRPQFSPDGKKIAFQSSQSGYHEIWVCDSDGYNCGSLTSLQGVAGAPRWSPDARYLAFEYHPHAYTEVYVAEVAGGQPRLVDTFPGADNGGPSWSRDGQWLYFYSDREHGRWQIWKTRLSGGPPIQVTKNGGLFGIESADGRFLYYAKSEPGIWRMPLDARDGETRILDEPGGGTEWCNWAVGDHGIYFLGPGPGSKASIQFFDFASRQKSPIFTLDRPPQDGLAISPDEKSMLFAQEELSESHIVLVKNFR